MATAQTAKKPAPRDWHKADIKAALEKANWSIRSLAKHHEISPTAAGRALTRKSPVSEQRIAAAIGVPAAVIWPSRYPVRVHAAPASHGSTGHRRRHANKSRVR